MSTSTYAVSGMTCAHCVSSVTEEISALPGVSAVEVDLDSGRVTVVSETPLTEGKVRDAVEEAGYRLVSAS